MLLKVGKKHTHPFPGYGQGDAICANPLLKMLIFWLVQRFAGLNKFELLTQNMYAFMSSQTSLSMALTWNKYSENMTEGNEHQ